MKKIIILAIMLISSIANADDRYEQNAISNWKVSVKFSDSVIMRSKIALTSKHLLLFKQTLQNVERSFFEYYDMDRSRCKNEQVRIDVITEYELSNRMYFPGEDDYTDKDGVVLGRYFRHSNSLYIVPPFTKQYYWRRNIAHEMLHYFYDDCMVKFGDNDKEHAEIDRFLNTYNHLFY